MAQAGRSRSRGRTYAVIVKGAEGVEPVAVKAIRQVSTGVRVVTCSPAEVEKIKTSVAIKAAGLRVEDPIVAAPRVMIMDVPQEIATDELMRQIYEKNVGEIIMPYAAYEKAVRLVSRPNTAEPTGYVVLEVPERLADA